MYFWQRATGSSKFERVTHERIREIMQVTHTIVDEIKTHKSYDMDLFENRIPKLIMNWKPAEGKKLGQSRSWQEDIDRIMQERNLGDMWRDGQKRRADIGRCVVMNQFN